MNQVEHIWLQNHEALLRFIRSRVSDVSAAEDIIQEVFIRINSGIDKLRMQNRL